MQAVILAAGEGTRMRPLTNNIPKPLLKICGKTLLDWIFEALPPEISEVVIAVNYLGDQIKKYCGDHFHGRNIIYTQGSARGTAYSFVSVRPQVRDERFLFIYGDELPLSADFKDCLSYPLSILCWEVKDPWNHGVVNLRSDGSIGEIEEKPTQPKSNIIADGIMVLNKRIFDFLPEKNDKSEFFFTDMVNKFVQNEKVMAVISKQGIGGISTPADLEKVAMFIKGAKI